MGIPQGPAQADILSPLETGSQWCRCDNITIAPGLLGQLEASTEPLERKLWPTMGGCDEQKVDLTASQVNHLPSPLQGHAAGCTCRIAYDHWPCRLFIAKHNMESSPGSSLTIVQIAEQQQRPLQACTRLTSQISVDADCASPKSYQRHTRHWCLSSSWALAESPRTSSHRFTPEH